MPYMTPIHSTIDISNPVTKELISMWNISMKAIMENDTMKRTPVDPVVANRYKYDFYGLLKYIGVPEEYHYPHMIANGYSSPLRYQGDVYDIILLNLETLNVYYSAFLK